MEGMRDPILPRRQLPPIPDGSGIMPIAENRIARGPHAELLDLPPEGFPLVSAPCSAKASSEPPELPELNELPEFNELNDALEQRYRRVLARALALAACALLLAAATAASIHYDSDLQQSFLRAHLLFRVVAVSQFLFMSLCSKHVEKLTMAPAAVLLFAYAIFCALEFSVLLSPATLAVAFLCAALMYAVTAIWGFVRRAGDLPGQSLVCSGDCARGRNPLRRRSGRRRRSRGRRL